MFDSHHSVVREDMDAILARPLQWPRLSRKHIYLTGSTGMLGTYLALTLAELGRRLENPPYLTLLVRNADKVKLRLGPSLDPDFCEVLEGALEAPPLSKRGRPDIIIHAASPASPRHYASDPIDVIRANALGTLALLDRFARDQQVSFLLLSSAVYGSTENDGAVHEESFGGIATLDPRNCYIESKRMAENILACWRAQYGLQFGIGRIFHTFGPGLNLEDGRIFSDVLQAAQRKMPILLTSDGSALRAFCYLADTVAGLFYILLNGEGANAYNVGNAGNEMSIRDFSTLASKLTEPPLPLTFGQVSVSHYLPAKTSRGLPDTRRLQALGWQPQYGVAEALRRTYRTLIV